MSERIRHLRLTLVMSGAVLIIAAVIAYVAGGVDGAIGVAAGVTLVAASYTASTLAIAWADTVNPRLVFPVGMGMYVTKFSLFGVMLIAIGATEWAGKIAMAVGIIIGVVAWTGAQIWWTTHNAHPYVSAN